MQLTPRWRIGLLVGSLLLVEGGLIWGIYTAVTIRRAVARDYAERLVEMSDLPRRLHALVGEIDAWHLRRPRDHAAEGGADKTEELQARVRTWIVETRRTARGEDERATLDRLQVALAAYLELSRQPADAGNGLAETERQLRALGDELLAERAGHDERVFAAAMERSRVFGYAQIGMIGLYIPLSALLAWLAYGRWVRPLRTQLVESQRQLAQREKLAALGTLAAGVAHEINNPLTAIKARLYSLRKNLAGANDAPAARDVAHVGREIDRLEAIVRGVLAYARPAEPRLVALPLEGYLRENAEDLRAMCAAAGAHFELAVEAGATVAADPGQIRQVLLNFVRNALEAFGGAPGTVTVGLRRETVFPSGRRAGHAVLTVRDNGPGVPPAVQARMFDPFFTTKKAGTGLGLPLVLGLVEKHGGELSFQSRPHHGAVFAVHLPLAPDPALP